uniref:Uncharacterized protein n=1 Tax=Meloidogyne incognita TaxID=6306 RepID=A0A914LFM7_MELIC
MVILPLMTNKVLGLAFGCNIREWAKAHFNFVVFGGVDGHLAIDDQQSVGTGVRV